MSVVFAGTGANNSDCAIYLNGVLDKTTATSVIEGGIENLAASLNAC